MHVEVRQVAVPIACSRQVMVTEQLCRVSYFLPSFLGFWGLNLGHRAYIIWQQVLLPTKPSRKPHRMHSLILLYYSPPWLSQPVRQELTSAPLTPVSCNQSYQFGEKKKKALTRRTSFLVVSQQHLFHLKPNIYLF